ncbi:MAG: adenosine deaminase, partial [Chlorobiota bacterium]
LYKNKFRVTVNTDNCLMSDTTMTKEFVTAVQTFDLNLDDVEKITINAMKSAFIHHNDRIRLIYDVIKPGYLEMRNTLTSLKL